MYCPRCDKDDVGNFHKCFMPGMGQIRGLKAKPTRNTILARKLATMYEQFYKEIFPGGIDNARIDRDHLAIRAYKDCGAWVWSLWVIDSSHGYPKEFGSGFPATECAKDYKKIIGDQD